MLTHNYGNYRILFLKWEFKRKHIIICLDYTVMSDFDMVSLFPQMQMLKIRYLSSLYVCLSILWINKREAQDAYEILFKGKINFFLEKHMKKNLNRCWRTRPLHSLYTSLSFHQNDDRQCQNTVMAESIDFWGPSLIYDMSSVLSTCNIKRATS